MNPITQRFSLKHGRYRVPLVPLLLLGAAGLTLATPAVGAGIELLSASPSGHSGTTDAGMPNSVGAMSGRIVPIVGSLPPDVIVFQSNAKDLLSGGADVNGMSDVYLFDTGQDKVVKLLSVATNGKAGCAGMAMCMDGGSHNPVIASSSLGALVAFESDAQNLTPGSLPLLPNAQTQIYVRNYSDDTTTLVTKSSQNASKGAVGSSSQITTGDGLRFAFTFAGDVTRLQGLTGMTDNNTTGTDIVYWDFLTNALKVASVRQSAQTQTGNGNSRNARMSADESCIVFESTSNDLDGTITGSHSQIFVRYTSTNTTMLVSKSANGQGGDLDSTNATPNADCSAIVFESLAKNLVKPGVTDSNGGSDIFLWTKAPTPTLTLVSASSAGNSTGNGGSSKPRLAAGLTSANGTVIAFESEANNLAAGDSPGKDIFTWIAPPGAPTLGTTALATPKFSGQGGAGGHDVVVAEKGEAILFVSDSDELLPNFDANGVQQIWLKSLVIPNTNAALASAADDGTPANAPCAAPVFQGGRVVFESSATNLTAAGVDANGAIDLFANTPAYAALTATNPTADEGDDLSITATRTSGLDTALTITLTVKPPSSGPAAVEGADFTIGTITMAPGSASKTISIPTLEDYLVEGDEGFALHATVTAGFGFVTSSDLEFSIVDDDHDADHDGVLDEDDDCPMTANSDQLDTDADGLGNVCDPTEGSCNDGVDDDNDGLVDCDDTECAADLTCGTSAEEDTEGDGVANVNDNCVSVANPDQLDTDADGIGNLCDTSEGSCGNFLDDDADGEVDCADTDCATDIACAAPLGDDDGDGIPNGEDDCPLAPNPLQSDTDSDGIGDACDTDEGICNDAVDNDADGKIDCADENCAKDAVCQKPDEDTDGDGFDNKIDDCPFVANPDQSDGDGDGAGDACDTKEDACANQADDDGDGKIDCDDENCASAPACADPTGDVDGDVVANDKDNCPNVSNPDQADTDGDGVGDACDKNPSGPPMPSPSGEGGAGGGAPQEPPPPVDAGCACTVSSGSPSELGWIAALGAGIWVARRRRARA
ncbi:MAG: thrombospondin type 3 repeat-containing protein [Polyangiaceae bacterium]